MKMTDQPRSVRPAHIAGALALALLLSACAGSYVVPPETDASRQPDRYTSSPELGYPTGQAPSQYGLPSH